MDMAAQTSNVETFYIDTGSSTLYFQTTENTVTIKDRTITLSRHSLARRPHEGRSQDAAPVRRLRPQPPA